MFGKPQCEMCLFLKEELDYERKRREYYEQIVLAKSGMVTDKEAVVDVIEYPTIHRATTLSSIRRIAEAAVKKAANPPTLTDAEKKFEDALSSK